VPKIDLRFVEGQQEMPGNDGVLYAVRNGAYVPLTAVRSAEFPQLAEGQKPISVTLDEDGIPWILQGVNDL
jgi:hypothetical protein